MNFDRTNIFWIFACVCAAVAVLKIFGQPVPLRGNTTEWGILALVMLGLR